ncbi:GAF domain-containing protein [Maricaulis sp.]|uniref:GAF domain-containing protein n=1 Tax=Maricaulis sp. TaxID=1486257 RepID=UPI001B257878|nr:GAF domain-containing protein [Maricaulis sp.]MBO6796656.1 GAF domain-containing protein [Maricaulis sp.]
MTSKAELYEDVRKQIVAVVTGETSHTARYATASCLLRETFGDRYFWTGFYVVDPAKKTELVVGPYQGTMGCLRIPFGKGVCGAAAATGKTQLVEDVHAYPGHIACDSRSNSEVVVPVFDSKGELAAVLDVDSTEFGAFDTEDQAGLEAICRDLLTV